jgi:hypothetical protein
VKGVQSAQWRGARLLMIPVAEMIDVEVEEQWESEMAEGVR